MENRLGAAVMVVGTIGAVAMLTIAFLKARPSPTPLSATPPTPATTSTYAGPLYDVLSGVAGITPIQAHPDTLGSSIAPTNPS
jgi:hypothetical protein